MIHDFAAKVKAKLAARKKFCGQSKRPRPMGHGLLQVRRNRRKKAAESVGKQRGGEIAVAGVGQQNDNGLAGVFRALGQLDGCPQRRAGGDADQHALAVPDLLAHGQGGIVVLGDGLIVDLGVQHIGDEAGADALDLVGAGDALAADGGGGGLHGHHLHGGILALQVRGRSFQNAPWGWPG